MVCSLERRLTAGVRKQRYPELDGLRGIAILLVVLHHYHFIPYVGGGVFVLSGFLLGGILMEKKGSDNYFRAFISATLAASCPFI